MADALGTAYGVILDRIRSSPEYIRAFETCVGVVKKTIAGASVEQMREMGGFTSIINRAIAKYALNHPEVRKNRGSAMITMTVADVLFLDKEAIREKCQR